ncbi:polysaccharide deacetylase family protein [Flavobacterium pectinovorum]|uniref:polysaccharide deacetylase family protein n=1 Tax=Flavobacterium pectinovorum TaxID=29533 RepID=UPI001FABB6F2|nr:polysaccharide deacetylase family protein [Flavobacterium pectinovorum]MCI9845599.1 polysaccharide deacetylase family protein [Flavobacterium pectinovorum]
MTSPLYQLSNKKLKNIIALITVYLFSAAIFAQTQNRDWNGKKCAIVLTYDDALNIHLDKVIPMLNSYKFKGTFYLIGSSPVVSQRIEEWRTAAKQGHELGNHTLNHPCDGSLPGRDFVTSETDLSKYTIARAVNETRITNTLLKAIDGKSERTFAYPCGDLTIKDTLFYNFLKNDFVAARGVAPGYLNRKEVDFSNVNSFFQNGSTAEQMIAQVEEAEKMGSFIVFMFHGVGGEHSLNIDLEEHQKLLEYLKKRKKDIWVATMVDVAKYIRENQNN